MKKRLRFLVVAGLTMAMVFGLNVSAYAEPDPEPTAGLPENTPTTIDCGNNEHTDDTHFYVTNEETYSFPDESATVYVEGRLFDNGEYVDYYKNNTDSSYKGFDLSNFSGSALSGIGWYVQNNEAKYESCPKPGREPDNTTELCEPNSPAHTHDFHWEIIVTPTKDQDGIEQEVCPCGAVRNIQKIPAMGFTLTEYATPLVVNAQPGQYVEMDFGEWNSFPKSFMEKVAVKTQQNVSFGFHYNWNHVGQEIKIPAGTKIDTNFDWYGPAKMQELYGSN